MPVKFTEYHEEVRAAFSMDVKKTIFSGSSTFQKIEIFESEYFGRFLVIDDMIMLTERDEFIYHEMIVHVPLFVHPNPQDVLVIGGGDGGAVREILKHKNVKHITLVEIDKLVSEVCLKYFPAISKKLLSEKVTCFYQDGVEFVKSSKSKYDIIIIDSTDPINVGEGLFTKKFYEDCYHLLNPEGILVNQAESPMFTPTWVLDIVKKLELIFPQVYFFGANIPTYPSGYWLFGFASKKYHPLEDFQVDKYNENQWSFKYYNCDIHRAAFALPNYIRNYLAST